MSLAVVDASVLVAFYSSDEPRRGAASTHLAAAHALFAPAHLDAEVVSALRGLARAHPTLARSVPAALAHLADFPIRRVPLASMLARMWELRHTITAYDAAYIALAERLDGPLITFDAKLTAASGAECTFKLVT